MAFIHKGFRLFWRYLNGPNPMSSRDYDWTYIRRHLWRFQGGDKWSREMSSTQVFVAQSNATGLRRVAGIGLVLLADALFDRVASPLLSRGMRGPHLGCDAPRWSVTRIAWRAADWALEIRGMLSGWGHRLTRYNR